ncbi:hypothetical protein [Acrocarpospora pleiomorpha]|uniref:hypothetical protein n=1 Tax=Acrocarpospora pleiomorpha TaxID=90975 RepID=UPI001FE72004|nr:hypothetical protein [Acrocarpospora pleiomorpha]
MGLIGAIAFGAGVLTSTPAHADTCAANTACSTTTTFDVTAGVLDITVPDTADLANDAAPGENAYGQLGAITVNDERASATPTWTASVDMTGTTGFTTAGGDGAGEVIPETSVYYFSGDATATTGDGTFTAGQPGTFTEPPTTPQGQTLAASRTAYGHTGGTGNNSATWNPYITAALALSNVSGQYTGTIAHTVV